jgi:hypothetical protein
MSGHWRFGAAAFLIAGLSTSPAFSNAITDLFNAFPQQAAPPPPAAPQEQCLQQPGKSETPGLRWVYHVDGRQKCWFQTDQATVSSKKQAHRPAPKRSPAAPPDNAAGLHKTAVLEARAQLGAVPPSQPALAAPAAPAAAVVDPAEGQGDAEVTPAAAPMAAQPATDQLPSAYAMSSPVDVEMPASKVDKGAVAAPVQATMAEPASGDADNQGLVARAGRVLIAMGSVFLAGSLLVSRYLLRA